MGILKSEENGQVKNIQVSENDATVAILLAFISNFSISPMKLTCLFLPTTCVCLVTTLSIFYEKCFF